MAGDLARLWKKAEGNRPRVSSPSGIQTWLLNHPDVEPEAADRMMRATVDLYHSQRGDLRVVPDPEAQASTDARLDGLAGQLGRMAGDLQMIKLALGIGEQVPAYADPLATPEAALASAEEAVRQTTQERMQAMAQRIGWLPGPGELVGSATPAGQALERYGQALQAAESATAAVADADWQRMWAAADHDAQDAS